LQAVINPQGFLLLGLLLLALSLPLIVVVAKAFFTFEYLVEASFETVSTDPCFDCLKGEKIC